jgi:hypothetical protein
MWNFGPMEMLIILGIATFLLAPVFAVVALVWYLGRSGRQNPIDRDERGD